MAEHVLVVGAGAFGGWTALSLLGRGRRVTLVDGWGAGHVRSSSGGVTRLIRGMYNGDPVYTEMVARAYELWRAAERRWEHRLILPTGVLYFFEDDDDFARCSLPLMSGHRLEVHAVTAAEGARRFPHASFDGVRAAYFEPRAGVLLARAACETVRERFEREGGVYRQAWARPGRARSDRLLDVDLDGARLDADQFVFACGPWLGEVFPDVVGDGIVATRQEVIYVGTPAGDARFDWRACPGWINFGTRRWYGMAGNDRRGFKLADDDPGPPIDPTSVNRTVSPDSIREAREFLKRRFPLLADQPVVETHVCQYEYSPDGDFLLDRHPGLSNVWLVGGGSGHGFKMGPALGEYVARLLVDGALPHRQFTYAHFAEGRERVRRTEVRPLHS